MTSFHPFIHNNRIWSAPLPAILMNGMLNPAEKEVALAGLCLTHLRPVSAERTRRSTSGTTRVGRGGGAAGCCLSCRSCLRLLSQGAVLTQVQKLLHRHLPARLLTPTLLPNRSIVSSSCCNPPPPPRQILSSLWTFWRVSCRSSLKRFRQDSEAFRWTLYVLCKSFYSAYYQSEHSSVSYEENEHFKVRFLWFLYFFKL